MPKWTQPSAHPQYSRRSKPGVSEVSAQQQLVDAMARIATETAGSASRPVQRERGRVAHRLRRHLAPWYVLAGVVAVAGVGDALSWAGYQGLATLASILLGASGVVVAYRRVPQAWRTRAVAGAAVGAAWMPWAVLDALSWEKALVLLLPFFGLKAGHDRMHRIQTPTEAPDPDDVDAPSSLQEDWDEYVAAPGKALPKTMLGTSKIEKHGDVVSEVVTGTLIRGEQTVDTVRGALKMIGSGLNVPRENLVIEEHSSRLPSLFQLKVIRQTPLLKQPVFFEGPDVRDGVIRLGPYVDGNGLAGWRLYSPKSMWSGMVIGEPGIGKSRLVETIALSALSLRNTVLIYIDGQDGMSSTMLTDHSHTFFESDHVDLALTALEAVQKHRQKTMREQRIAFKPSEAFPGIFVVVDECHAVINSGNAERWAKGVREGRKFGLGKLLADQDSTLETFKKGVLRAGLQAGNTIGMHTEDRDAGQILTKGSINLFDLPRVKGYAHVLASADGLREAPFRARWLPDAEDAEEHDLPPNVVLIDEWFRRFPGIGMDEGSQRAWDSVLSGVAVAESMSSASSTAEVLLGFPPPFVDAAGPILSESHRRVLDAVQAGYTEHRAIVAEVGLSDRRVRDLARDLVEAGELVKLNGSGRYALTDVPVLA